MAAPVTVCIKQVCERLHISQRLLKARAFVACQQELLQLSIVQGFES